MAVAVRIEAATGNERAMALAATVALHALVIFLILSARIVLVPVDKTDAIVTFDVSPPPRPVVPPPPEPPRPQRDMPLRNTPQSAPAPVTPAIPRPEVAAATSQHSDVTPAITETSPPPAMDTGIGVGAGGPAPGSGSGGGSGGSGTGGSGAGGNGSGDGPTFLKADWVRKPEQHEWLAVWPAEAARKKASGWVMLSCFVRRNGQPRGCRVEQERPQGYGFGRAAVRLSPVFRVRPVTRDGAALDLPVRIPLEFPAAAVGR